MFKRASDYEYEIIKKWYEVQNDHAFNADATGRESYVYFRNHIPVSSLSILHPSGSSLALIGWLIVNPVIKKLERTQAINSIISYVEAIAKGRGAKIIMSYSSSENSADRLKELGYFKAPIKQFQSFKWVGDKNV